MIRLRWNDPNDSALSHNWRLPALVIATLFLNLEFCYRLGITFTMQFPLPVYAFVLAIVTVLVTLLFFCGPALACSQFGGGLFATIERSVGSVPAHCIRLCSAWFLVVWIAGMIAVMNFLMLPFILRRNASVLESSLAAVGLLSFLLFTGVQGLRTNAKLAVFTNKLALAVLFAALLRVHEGWPAVLRPFADPERSVLFDLWTGTCLLAVVVAPLAFLAADYTAGMRNRKDVALTSGFGFAAPLFVGLLVTGMIATATHASSYYQPSLTPDIAMALWGKAAASALPPRMMLAAITVFGAIRFGGRALRMVLSTATPSGRIQGFLTACLVGAIAWCSLHSWESSVSLSLEISSNVLAVMSGVLAADFVCGRFKTVGTARTVEWVGLAALTAGLLVAFLLRHAAISSGGETWFTPWLLPSYGVAFLTGILGHVVERRRSPMQSPTTTYD